MHAITLVELNRMVSEMVNSTFCDTVWVTAELTDVRVAQNGHCYMQLIQKDPKRGSMLAFANAHIWANRWWLLRDTFQQQTGQAFQSGLKVMLCVQVTMHEVYGYALNVVDVDPSYTLGEMARRRREILQQLEADGIIDMNRELSMPQLPQRVAIVSAAGAAGYGDFCHQLEGNEWGVRFYTRLFPAVMQGKRTESSVIEALERIFEHQEWFDVVVIIRGGGATGDLASFDSYDLASCVANFPLPVITGIGHDRDQTVLDRVAHTSVKTPTAAAALLIDMMAEQVQRLQAMEQTLLEGTRGRIEREELRLTRLTQQVRGSHVALGQQINRLTLTGERIKMLAQQHISTDRQKLDYMAHAIDLVQPTNILKRGFSIVRAGGKAVRDASAVDKGTQLDIETANGILKATTL